MLGVLAGLLMVGTVAADPTPGIRIQIPRIDVGDGLGVCTDYCDPDSENYDEDLCDACVEDNYWETWIQVQNVSPTDTDTGAIFFGWEDYSGLCPSNAPGPQVHYCQLIRGNAIWTLKNQLAEGVKSGIIYSVRADVFAEACDAAGWAEGDTHKWLEWEKEWRFGTGFIDEPYDTWGDPVGAQGEELAVTVNRYGPNHYGTFVSSAYTGISEEMEGVDPPYEYFAPYVMKGYNGLDTEMTIQNSGELCTSVWIRYKEQGTCATLYDYHIEQLAPGESIRVRVPCDVGQIPCFWLGSAQIRAEQPLGIIVDETSFDEPCEGVNRGTLLTHRARAKVELRDGEEMLDYKVYADLIFREWSGWDASIQVQNLSRTGQHTFVTVDFMDNSGDEILFLADWVCAGGSTTFYLPIVTNLGFDYVGAAEIQSHDQIDYPGTETPAQPIFAVVDLKKPDNPDTPELDAQGGSYNAHPRSQKELVTEIALPFMAKDARDLYTPWTSMIAIRNNSNCNKIKPKIWFKDETGTLLCELKGFWLQPQHVKLIDLNNIGCLYPGYMGAAKVIVEQVEQLCDVDQDGVVDQQPTMPSVIVVEKGYPWLGDVTKIYEGIPYKYEYWDCNVEICGNVIEALDLKPINGAEIYTHDRVDEGPFMVSGTAYISPTVGCPDPVGPIRLAGATVELQVNYFDDPNKDGIGVWRWKVEGDTTTNGDGYFEFEDALELETGGDPDVDEDGDEREYRLSLSVQANGSTVSYRSGEFDDRCDAEMDFTIETGNGGLDLTSGTWCPADIAECFADNLHTTTDSTGHFCFDYSKTAEPKDIIVKAAHTDHITYTETLLDVECDDQVVNFELDPLCDDIWVQGAVYDKETGLPLVDETGVFTVTVSAANNAPSFDSATTDANGKYSLDLTFAQDVTEVTAEAHGYYPHTTSLFIPKCITATVDFELHCIPESRVLMYYGNGGADKDEVNDPHYFELAARYAAMPNPTTGDPYIVDYTDEWPSDPDLACYRMVVLLVPGLASDELPDNGFTEAQVSQMGLLIARGGRVILISDDDTAFGDGLGFAAGDYAVQMDLLDRLGIGIDFDDDFEPETTYDEDIAEDAYGNEFTQQHLEGDGFTELSLDDDAFQLYDSGADGEIVIAGDKVGDPNVPDLACAKTGHDVIVIGDDEVLADTKLSGGWPENETFADELISFPTTGTCP
jgi:hypothetical protein